MITQVPTLTGVTILPETVQTDGVVEAKITGKPELAVADNVSGVPRLVPDGAMKLMV